MFINVHFLGFLQIMKIGDRGCHNEDEVTPVEAIVVNLQLPHIGQLPLKWRAGDTECGLTLQLNSHPSKKRNRHTAASNESKPQR